MQLPSNGTARPSIDDDAIVHEEMQPHHSGMLRVVRALIVNDTGRIALDDVPRPHAPGECLIRVRIAGICGTDLQLLDGYADFRGILGHEFVGTVESVASADDFHWVGKRVVGEINVGCGDCAWCDSGEKEHCPTRTVVGIRGRGGAFADYITLPAANLHSVPDAVDDRTAVFVEPVAAACRILEQLAFSERSQVAVMGDGRLGLLVAQVLRTKTPEVTILGHHDGKMDVARALGLAARRACADDERRFDVVVEASGRPAALMEAAGFAKPRGIVVMKSTVHGEAPIATWPLVVNELTLVGSRCGPFASAIDMLASSAVRVDEMVSRVYALEDHAAAFTEATRGLKVLFALERGRS